MKKKDTFYITTTLPYVNAEPHIGFALEILQADVLARWKRHELGAENVFFNTGTDEHGQKIFEAAGKAGKEIQEYTDYYAGKFGELRSALNLSYDKFIRTTDKDHVEAAQELWRRCKKDIYEKEFEGFYCVGCERFLSQRDLVDGKCSIHAIEPKRLREKNWFFNFKKYEKDLLEYLAHPQAVIPDWRRLEAINFVKEGLEDFSISRDKKRLSWGVPVPDDGTQVMYVWFDALTNYISTLGWPRREEDFKKFWLEGHTVQMAGKDQVRFQSLMWQAMLMSAGIKNTDQIFYHGFINSDGQKMSKSLGNVISPFELVNRYGTDGARYLLLRHVHPTEDTDVTWEKLDEWYDAGLANGLGNLTSRIMKMAESNLDESVDSLDSKSLFKTFVHGALESFDSSAGIGSIWGLIEEMDEQIQREEPFKLIKTDSKRARELIKGYVKQLDFIARQLEIFLPETSKKIIDAVEKNKKPENLFPRINA